MFAHSIAGRVYSAAPDIQTKKVVLHGRSQILRIYEDNDTFAVQVVSQYANFLFQFVLSECGHASQHVIKSTSAAQSRTRENIVECSSIEQALYLLCRCSQHSRSLNCLHSFRLRIVRQQVSNIGRARGAYYAQFSLRVWQQPPCHSFLQKIPIELMANRDEQNLKDQLRLERETRPLLLSVNGLERPQTLSSKQTAKLIDAERITAQRSINRLIGAQGTLFCVPGRLRVLESSPL